MPIRRYITVEMEPAEIKRLNSAYTKALRMLELVDRRDPVTEMVAKKVIDVGTTGVTDPQEIAELVVSHFRKVPS
jgi:hypothetical protein